MIVICLTISNQSINFQIMRSEVMGGVKNKHNQRTKKKEKRKGPVGGASTV